MKPSQGHWFHLLLIVLLSSDLALMPSISSTWQTPQYHLQVEIHNDELNNIISNTCIDLY